MNHLFIFLIVVLVFLVVIIIVIVIAFIIVSIFVLILTSLQSIIILEPVEIVDFWLVANGFEAGFDLLERMLG